MKKYETPEGLTTSFSGDFFSVLGYIEKVRVERAIRLAYRLRAGTFEGDDNGNRVIVKDGLIFDRIIKSLDIWEHLGDSQDRHTVLDLDSDRNEYNDFDPLRTIIGLTATQELYEEEELTSVETYSSAPDSANTLRLRNVVSSLKAAKQLQRADQTAA